MKRKVLSLLLCGLLACSTLTACGGSDDSAKSGVESDVEVSDGNKEEVDTEKSREESDNETSNNAKEDSKESYNDEWKEFCLTEDILDDVLFSNNARFNIVDIDSDGIPEILSRREDSNEASRSATGYYTILFSFYDVVNEDKIDISEPELFKIAHGSDIYIVDNKIVMINKCNYGGTSLEGTLDRIRIVNDFPYCRDDFSVERDTEPVTGNLLNTFSGKSIDGASVSEDKAYEKASEFLKADVLSLPETEFPYSYDELIEALKNY